MEYDFGPFRIRTNFDIIDPHTHEFDHLMVTRVGWWFVRAITSDGKEKFYMTAAPQYDQVREMMIKYEPENVLRPVRFPDIDNGGKPMFNISFIKQGEEIPKGAHELLYNPTTSEILVMADALHEAFPLTAIAHEDCFFTHRNADGTVSQKRTGMEKAYY